MKTVVHIECKFGKVNQSSSLAQKLISDNVSFYYDCASGTITIPHTTKGYLLPYLTKKPEYPWFKMFDTDTYNITLTEIE
jgi:hypothetical protein